jgi:predicted DCC family thiol-disulfide oxidoreductase YuxK
VDIEKVRGEFGIKEADLQLRIAVVSGDKLIWGAEAIMEICQWMCIPYPAAAIGRLLPHSLSDSLYLTIARNRYDFFGTQPLDKNFAKKLCPYYWINPEAAVNKAEGKKED